MAKVKLHPFLSEVHGKIGDFVFRRTPGGETTVYKAPKRSRGNTRAAQKLQQHRMKDAHAYARSAMADPEMREHYEQEGTKNKKSAYAMALSTYFRVQRRMKE